MRAAIRPFQRVGCVAGVGLMRMIFHTRVDPKIYTNGLSLPNFGIMDKFFKVKIVPYFSWQKQHFIQDK